MKIGIIFGGQSREREVSFAGGRTVYDNLDKNIFEPVPIFVDSLGNFILLEWQYIYKGTIRDFYPPITPTEENPFQVYVESLKILQHENKKLQNLIEKVGKRVFPHEFSALFDFAFLTLHGAYGEDGNIQGLLEWYNIPYSGSGILPSAIGIDKITQSQLLTQAGFKRPKQVLISREEWLNAPTKGHKKLLGQISRKIGFPMVIKAPQQGSSIGVSIVEGEWARTSPLTPKGGTKSSPFGGGGGFKKKMTAKSIETFSQWEKAINKSFFRLEINLHKFYKASKKAENIASENNQGETVVKKKTKPRKADHFSNGVLDEIALKNFLTQLTDIRESIGFPLMWETPNVKHIEDKKIVYSPQELHYLITSYFPNFSVETLILSSIHSEEYVLVEEFIQGKEFSCIVIQDQKGNPIALPPTEIRKFKNVFDYRSKYLPGTSSKITPIEVEEEIIEKIRENCVELYKTLHANVYARIDGFITPGNEIFLNDPNTTSGMLPSSFFFHQSAEIGLNSKDFLTYIIRTSLSERKKTGKNIFKYQNLLKELDENIQALRTQNHQKTKVAVIMGGYSSERHISMESGRNVFEKLSSSTKYDPFPVFLMGNENAFELYELPLNYMLKDNADDIAKKIKYVENAQANQKAISHPIIQKIKQEFAEVTKLYASNQLEFPTKLSLNDLKNKTSLAFIALHGRPGEDGALQNEFEKIGISYNGSGVESSQITINKYQTNEILAKNGILVAKHSLVYEKDWQENKNAILEKITKDFQFPLIAKPADDGCSSAVKKLKNITEFCAFAEMMFRKELEFLANEAQILKLTPKEEFPQKNYFLVEELISKGYEATHFLEITGGMLTHFDENNDVSYEIFPPSEALAVGDVLSLEEKFLAGEGQNITPARYYPTNPILNKKIEIEVQKTLKKTAQILNVVGYCRIDAFVRIWKDAQKVEVIIIEVNSLPGMTPATCIFHQASLHKYKPFEFIDKILEFGGNKN